jgi:hypothetical protein
MGCKSILDDHLLVSIFAVISLYKIGGNTLPAPNLSPCSPWILSKVCHGSVEVMEIKRFGSRNEIVFSPTFSGSIAATGKKPMQHGEINGSLNVKVVAASFER